jgi:hypothetical protein
MTKDLPVVAHKADIDTYALEMVRVIGRYIQIDVRQRQRHSPVYSGHVALVLGDGTNVLLNPIWESAAKRSPDEITRYEGKRVIVIGTIYPQAPSSPENEANVLMPCLTDIVSLELVVA